MIVLLLPVLFHLFDQFGDPALLDDGGISVSVFQFGLQLRQLGLLQSHDDRVHHIGGDCALQALRLMRTHISGACYF